MKLFKSLALSAVVGLSLLHGASLTTKEDKRDAHLKSEDFFDVVKYPKMHLKLLKHNINFNKMLETGGLLVGDAVKFDIVLEGIQTK